MRRSLSNLPRVIALILALLTVAGFFLPYVSLDEEHREKAEAVGWISAGANTDITINDVKDVTLLEYAQWCAGGQLHTSDSDNRTAMIFTLIMGGLALLLLLFALVKRATPLIIFAAIQVVFHNMYRDVLFGGVGDGSIYLWGIGQKLLLYCPMLLIAAGIWLFVAKAIDKRRSA